jgi:transposase
MKPRDQIRYSDSFRRHVVDELESGRFASMSEAKRHYGIGGWNTIPGWLRKYGKNHLLPKVVIVQRPNEKDQIRELRRQKQELEQALGQMQLQNMISEKRLEIACEELGVDVEAFKKKRIGKVPTKSTKNKA